MKAVLRALVRFYQLFFSHWVNAGCRYTPSCSHYALQALDRHGAAGGSYLAARRILRCNPFCLGGHDPVPEEIPGLFSGLLSPTKAAGASRSPQPPSSP
ncbi:membrane protein insertion efficiency factor YidD [Inhella sp.]|uniref:membrane protein insertion efficiency factor YidD n=1 Tax=Inhella sp. TaxID=1921806 RepID=UPI0035B16499